MLTPPYAVPVFRVMTIVATALSREASGDMVHRVISHSSEHGPVEVHFEMPGPARSPDDNDRC